MKKVIAIHQPNFCPYEGYFQKMEQADKFILMSECQFEKNGYQNRFKHDGKWYTMSINQALVPIKEKHYANPETDWYKILDQFPILNKLNIKPNRHLLSMNLRIIMSAAHKLGITTELGFDFPTKNRSTERLIEIVKYHRGTHYLSGMSGRNYMDMKLWEEAKIEVIFQDESTISKKSLIQIL